MRETTLDCRLDEFRREERERNRHVDLAGMLIGILLYLLGGPKETPQLLLKSNKLKEAYLFCDFKRLEMTRDDQPSTRVRICRER